MGMPELKEADEKLRFVSRTDDLRFAYLSELKRQHDAINFREGWIQHGYDKGVEKGREEGRHEGLQKGLQKGLQEGRQEGALDGQRQSVQVLLEARFGPLPASAMRQLQAIQDANRLNSLLIEGLQAPTLASLGLA